MSVSEPVLTAPTPAPCTLAWCWTLTSCLLACRPSEATRAPNAENGTFAETDTRDDTATLEASEVPTRSPRPPQTIYRSEIDRALGGGPAYLLRQLGPEPFRHGGRFVGWELTRVFPDDRGLCTPGCDIEVGDVILTVAGNRLETPQALSQLLERLPELETLEVRSLRNGKQRLVSYDLVEDR